MLKKKNRFLDDRNSALETQHYNYFILFIKTDNLKLSEEFLGKKWYIKGRFIINFTYEEILVEILYIIFFFTG